jgi:hypothetical protein
MYIIHNLLLINISNLSKINTYNFRSYESVTNKSLMIKSISRAKYNYRSIYNKYITDFSVSRSFLDLEEDIRDILE